MITLMRQGHDTTVELSRRGARSTLYNYYKGCSPKHTAPFDEYINIFIKKRLFQPKFVPFSFVGNKLNINSLILALNIQIT